MSTSRLTSQLHFPPDRKTSAVTQTNHPPSRIFIGSLSSQLPVPSSSSSSHSRNPSSEADEPRQRKRDVIRRRRKKSNSVGEWGENKAGPGGVRGWVGRKVAGVGGESEERLVQASAAAAAQEEEEEEDVGLGWFRIRWEGDARSSGSRSREQSAESSGGKGGRATELNRKRAASVGDVSAGLDKKFFHELPQGLTSSPLATPTLPEASSSFLNLAPGPSHRDRSSSQPPPSSSSTFPSSSNPNAPSSSPLRPPPVTQVSNVSSVVDSFVTAQSFVSASSFLPPTAPELPHTSSASSLPDHSSSRIITPPTRQTDGLPTFHHTPASPTSSLHHPAASLPPTNGGPSQTVPPALLRSALRRPTVEPKSQTVHFPVTPVLSRIGSFGRGKGKQGVLVEEIEEPEQEDTLEADGEPADPSVVLGRSEAPSPGEAGQEDEDDRRDFGVKDVILRGESRARGDAKELRRES